MKKIQVVISEDNKNAVSDWNVESWYQELLRSGEVAFVATATMLNELRIGVRLGEIEPFSFQFKGQTINVLPTGELDQWPSELGDHLLIQMDVLLHGITREEAKSKNRNTNNN